MRLRHRGTTVEEITARDGTDAKRVNTRENRQSIHCEVKMRHKPSMTIRAMIATAAALLCLCPCLTASAVTDPRLPSPGAGAGDQSPGAATARDWATASLGAREASREWNLAEGCTAAGFETWILVQNPGPGDADVQLTYMTGEGAVQGPSRVIKPGTRATFNAADTVGSAWEVATRVTSSGPVIAERSMYGGDWATASLGAREASREWNLAEGCTAAGFETWILVQNPGPGDADVQLTYMTGEGAVQGPSRVIKPGTRATFNAADTVGSAWEVATRVTSSGPVIAERSMYGVACTADSRGKQLYGVCCGYWQKYSSKDYSPIPQAYMNRYFDTIAPFAQWVTNYGLLWDDDVRFVTTARRKGFSVSVCPQVIWSASSPDPNNAVQIGRACALVENGVAGNVVIGNEVLSHLDPKYGYTKWARDMVRYINQVKAKRNPHGSRVKVGTSFDSGVWTTAAESACRTVASHCDFVQITAHPANEAKDRQPAGNPVTSTDKAIQRLKTDYYQRSRNKLNSWGLKHVELQIRETGWPTRSDFKDSRDRLFTAANARDYLAKVKAWAKSGNIKVFWFEAVDEPPKAPRARGSVYYDTGNYEANWGIWHWTPGNRDAAFSKGSFKRKY